MTFIVPCQNTSRTYGTKIEYAFHQTLFPRAIKRLGTRLGKGLAHFEPFLVFADSTVQDLGLPISLQACDFVM